MKITILIEGKTEMAFKHHLVEFLENRLAGQMPRLDMYPYHGRIPKEAKLRRTVEYLLSAGTRRSDAVIALTDIYTGTQDFVDAADAKAKMHAWVGPNQHFFPHVAQHDFEAWLLPYWTEIQKVAGHNKKAPPGPPESVNHNRPPSYHIQEVFRVGTCRRDYSKPRDGKRILQRKDLTVAATKCPELKAFLDTILKLSGGIPLQAISG